MPIGKHNKPPPTHYEQLGEKKIKVISKTLLLLLSNKVKFDFGDMLNFAVGKGFLIKHMQDYKKKKSSQFLWKNESGISIYRVQSGSLSSRYQLKRRQVLSQFHRLLSYWAF